MPDRFPAASTMKATPAFPAPDESNLRVLERVLKPEFLGVRVQLQFLFLLARKLAHPRSPLQN
jgi:hypothetical protein